MGRFLKQIRRLCASTAVVVLFVLLFGTEVFAGQARLSWNANTESDLSGYKIYFGTLSQSYQFSQVLGDTTSITLSGLVAGERYYFAVTAYDVTGKESSHSSEVNIVISGSGNSNPGSGPGDTDGDGVPDSSDNDDDNDGISDTDEISLGTNPLRSDTDNDGVSDGQELLDGSNPLDRGSAHPVLSTTVCSEWNGFLNGLWNILEVVNVSNSERDVEAFLYNITGEWVGYGAVSIASGAQADILIHDHQAREEDSYGLVCLRHDGEAGDIDGRMVYYKGTLTPSTSTEAFQFAFAMPFTNGKRGEQVVPFNTYQPSLSPADAGNLVANWIQLTNIDTKAVSGQLSFYNISGDLLGSREISISNGQRVDISGHQYGINQVGLVKWAPEVDDVSCQLRNVRYLYDNPNGANSFTTAFQLEGLFGSGESIAAPLNTEGETSILEVANPSETSSSVTVSIYSSGSLVTEFSFVLEGNESRHIIVDELIGLGARGVAIVQANSGDEVSAVVMQYGRNTDGSISYMYGIPAKQALGAVMRSSYNTFLSQEVELILVNPGSEARTATISMTRSDGTDVLVGEEVIVAPMSVQTVTLNNHEVENIYGVVVVQSDQVNSLISWVTRKRGSEYVIPTPVR